MTAPGPDHDLEAVLRPEDRRPATPAPPRHPAEPAELLDLAEELAGELANAIEDDALAERVIHIAARFRGAALTWIAERTAAGELDGDLDGDDGYPDHGEDDDRAAALGLPAATTGTLARAQLRTDLEHLALGYVAPDQRDTRGLWRQAEEQAARLVDLMLPVIDRATATPEEQP